MEKHEKRNRSKVVEDFEIWSHWYEYVTKRKKKRMLANGKIWNHITYQRSNRNK
jgi:hypothetical protein